MHHPSPEGFMHLQNMLHEHRKNEIALLPLIAPHKHLVEYALLTSYGYRVLCDYAMQRGDYGMALTHVAEAWTLLGNIKEHSYGTSTDYANALQVTTLLYGQVLYLLDDPRGWYRGRDMVKAMLDGMFPSIYRADNKQTGPSLTLLLVGLLNRLEQHAKAIELCGRLQGSAQEHDDILTELRATGQWAFTTVLYGKFQALNGKSDESHALLQSALHVVRAFKGRSEIQSSSPQLWLMMEWLGIYLEAWSEKDIAAFVDRWKTLDDEAREYLVEIVELHSTAWDNDILRAIHSS